MKDYCVTVKIQQGRLMSAMHQMKIYSVAELSRQSGISVGTIHGLLNFRKNPRKSNDRGEWKDSVIRICAFLCCEPSEIFPDHLQHEITTNSIAQYVDQNQLADIGRRQLSPYDDVCAEDMKECVSRVMDTLTDKEQSVLRLRYFENKTLEEAGAIIGTSGTYARLIEARAVRKLRHPSRVKKIEGLL